MSDVSVLTLFFSVLCAIFMWRGWASDRAFDQMVKICRDLCRTNDDMMRELLLIIHRPDLAASIPNYPRPNQRPEVE